MIEKKNPVALTCVYILLAVITAITLLPFIWMVLASFKNDADVFALPKTAGIIGVFRSWVPDQWIFPNYLKFWTKITWGTSDAISIPPFVIFILNSFKLSLLVTVVQVITSSFAAYGFAKCRFHGRNTLFFMYVATIAIPWQVYMLPQFMELTKMGLTDTHIGYILLQSFTAFGVFLVRQFYLGIPDELLDAARIDGLNEYGTYFRIVLPLSKPVLATLVIMSFVGIWNDFMGPLIYFNSTMNKTIPLGIRMFLGQYATDYGLMMAASVISLLPVFVVFLAFQRFFVQGIATSGLKG
ncbi:MAG: carbohydrate ABC transporter permease [Treponema sp.]|jgi:multiple sugar transport system permease protein|nr:carbohydrate ABC transporter permease [Treponema sp.]